MRRKARHSEFTEAALDALAPLSFSGELRRPKSRTADGFEVDFLVKVCPLLLTRLSAAQRKRNATVALELVGLSECSAHSGNSTFFLADNIGSRL